MSVVLIETDAEGVIDVSAEVLTFARNLLGGSVDALVVGEVDDAVRDQLTAYGVGRVLNATGPGFDAYAGAAWASAAQAALAQAEATAVLAAGTPRGNEVMAHVAAREDVLMAANVVACQQDDGGLLVTRQVVGGAALEVMSLDGTPAVLTVAGHAVEASEATTPGEAVLVSLDVHVAEADLLARVVSAEPPPPDESGALKSAKVVVGAGRGAGSENGFGDVTELAALLGGSVGVSRVVTSLGWRPHHEQVGQTGSRISPDLYIACGISGAIQHWAGCSAAKTIVAVNNDPDAPMVTKAHYAVIGDMHEILPAVLDELRRRG